MSAIPTTDIEAVRVEKTDPETGVVTLTVWRPSDVARHILNVATTHERESPGSHSAAVARSVADALAGKP